MEDYTVHGLENQLVKTLIPIKPRREFIADLGRKVRNWRNLLLDTSNGTWKFFILVLMGLLSLAIFVALISRSLFQLLGIKK